MSNPDNFDATQPLADARAEKVRGSKWPKQTDRVFIDRDWWIQFLPIGWRLYGFNERISASFLKPGDNQLISVNGYLMQALVACGKLKP